MSIFTKRHYVWLASVARDIKTRSGDDLAIAILAEALEDESLGFDKKEFLRNVYVPSTETIES